MLMSDKCQEKLSIFQEFLKIYNWRVTICVWEGLETNAKAVGRRGLSCTYEDVFALRKCFFARALLFIISKHV